MNVQRAGAAAAGIERIGALDVLRGIALLGMFLVHFSNFASDGGRADGVYQQFVSLMLEERFWGMFAILFGAGFAIQFARAGRRGDAFVPRFLRRMAALAALGFVAHSVFGFNVLLGYAVWGVPLLLVRRWSTRALFIATLVCATSGAMYYLGRVAYRVSTVGDQAAITQMTATRAKNQEFRRENQKAQDATDFVTVFKARLQHMRWFYAQSYSFLPFNDFTLFLLGALALRIGLFNRPEEHRRFIAGLMAFGVLSWVAVMWLIPFPGPPRSPMMPYVAKSLITDAFGLLRPMWLTFAYMGGVLLLVARNPRWLQHLAIFGWTGRMALTNYMVQIAILDLTFSKYALGLSVTPLVGCLLAIALFLADALFSRWWLARFEYGPLEWLWRAATYARWPRLVQAREAMAG